MPEIWFSSDFHGKWCKVLCSARITSSWVSSELFMGQVIAEYFEIFTAKDMRLTYLSCGMGKFSQFEVQSTLS